MAPLLESTRNYLKTSTKLGRRMSQYKEDSTDNGSLKSDSTPKDQKTATNSGPRRPSPQNRLSGLFAFESRTRNSTSDDRPGMDALEKGRRGSRGSNGTRRSTHSQQSDHLSKEGSVHMENGIPRGRSPALSISNSTTTAASSYDARPSDYSNMKQYQSHVWRRNLLEESIMHSLRLGYAERARPSSRHRSRSRKRSSRAQKTREQAILAAAMGKDLPPNPIPDPALVASSQEMSLQEDSLQETVVPRSGPTPTAPKAPAVNSPYQHQENASMANITHSFASFTLELPEHQVSHIMSSSAVPDLFQVKAATLESVRPRGRRDSKIRLGAGHGPSPRVLTGRRAATREEGIDSPVSPTTAAWVNSVFATLDQHEEPSQEPATSLAKDHLNTLSTTAPAV